MPKHIPIREWGSDHWTTLLYLETCAVDNFGILQGAKMRPRSEKYPTRLKGGRVEENHGDYDCLADALNAGLLFTEPKGRYVLTDLGWAVIGRARRYRAENMSYPNPAVDWDWFDPGI